MLRLDLVYVRLKDPIGEEPVEMARVAPSQKLTARPQEIGEMLDHWLGDDPQKWPAADGASIGDGDISIVPLRLGLQGEIGVLVAGSRRADFPEQTERLLLSVAANQAAIGLQEAQLLSRTEAGRDELDRRVAQRTAELAAANEELKNEIAERKLAEERLHQEESELKRSEARKTAILDSALDCIVTIDHEGRITEFNPAAERTFGYRRDEVMGKQLADVIIPPSLREQHRQGFARYLATGEERRDREAHRDDRDARRRERIPGRTRDHTHPDWTGRRPSPVTCATSRNANGRRRNCGAARHFSQKASVSAQPAAFPGVWTRTKSLVPSSSIASSSLSRMRP